MSFSTTFEPQKAATIIGVVATVKQRHPTEVKPTGMVYSPFIQFPSNWFRIVARTQMPPETMAKSLRRAVAHLDPELVVTKITTMEQLIDDSLLTRRAPAILTAIFAGVALVLATVGTYGVLAYTVSHRRREIGVWVTGRAMQNFLFEIVPFPPVLIAATAALMGLVVLVAILVPSIRAATIDPSETLRHE
ncbi:MAG: hypothetical protein J6386_11250 [Candidatus Synoicihabitans palmerolidicus]|nr:hypothetical protein [Candidatus Synoicihabitans palmerolidicus]